MFEYAKANTKLDSSLLGARACFELREFEEAVTWCDKGLAVSFSFVDANRAIINLYLSSTVCNNMIR